MVLFYADKHRALKLLSSSYFRSNNAQTGCLCWEGGPGIHGALKVVFHWLFEVK